MTEQASAASSRGRLPMTAPAADPVPLGFAAFAFTLFLLSASNAGWMGNASGNAWVSYALAYGGFILLLAGIWEFRNRHIFEATAFSTYGGFWIGLALWAELVAPKATATAVDNDAAWILLAFAIFNTYMLLWSSLVSLAVFSVFLTLEATEIILVVALFTANTSLLKVGGYAGVLTAVCAWFTSSAGVLKGMRSPSRNPVVTAPAPVTDVAQRGEPEIEVQVAQELGQAELISGGSRIRVAWMSAWIRVIERVPIGRQHSGQI